MGWSKEVLKDELNILIGEAYQLKTEYKTTTFMHFIARINTLLQQVYTAESSYNKMFRAIQWNTSKMNILEKGLMYTFSNPSVIEKKYYLEALDSSIGILQAMIDELNFIDNNDAFLRDLFWNYIHPEIRRISESRFKSGHYADSVEAALKHVNSFIKDIVKIKTGQEYDGADLMNRAFSPTNKLIILEDLSTESGKSIQLGFMQIFAGAMTGIRNPKAHDNINISAERAMHFLFLASMLMNKIDERVS